jgi:tRNA G10  N-methylase Trm11
MDNLSTINTYAFVLGRERELCLAELKAVLLRFGFCFGDFSVAENVVFINIEKTTVDMPSLLATLGGTIKIFKIIGPMNDKIKPVLEEYIKANPKKEGKFNFALSSYSPKFDQRRLNSLGLEIKKDFKGKFSSRFIELREGKEVSTILSLKSKLVEEGFEFGLFNESLGILVATTNPVEWSVRDYEKPAGDKYSGMLPPKLARIMINLALGEVGQLASYDNCIVVDPFCGSGNVAMESLMLKIPFFASDKSFKAVNDTSTNILWLQSKNEDSPKIPYLIAEADATTRNFLPTIDGQVIKNVEEAIIVTEPYLGEPKKFMPTLKSAKGEYAKVKELYLSFFANMANLKHYNPVFCVVFPLVETTEGRRFSLYRDCVDEIKKIGYTELQSPLVYGRDYQVVKREILLLTLGKAGSL